MLGELPGLLLVLVTLKTALVTESKAPSGYWSPCEKGSSARVTLIQFPVVSSSKLKKSDA